MADDLRVRLRPPPKGVDGRQEPAPELKPITEAALELPPKIPSIEVKGATIGAPHRQQTLRALEVVAKKTAPEPGVASKNAIQDARRKTTETIARLQKPLEEVWTFGVRASAHAAKLKEQLAQLVDELQFGARMLEGKPSQRAVLDLGKLSVEARQLGTQLDAYLKLRMESWANQTLTGIEAAARQEEIVRLQAKEPELRGELKAKIAELLERLYVTQSRLAPIEQRLLDGPGVFLQDPLQVVAAFRAQAQGQVRPEQNVAVAELEIGGQVRSIGPAASGIGPGSLPRTKHYAVEARSLTQRPGQGGFPRNNDSEVQILEAVHQDLLERPGAKGTLRIYSENPCCKSCLRVLSKFRAEHPTIKVEVYSTRGVTE